VGPGPYLQLPFLQPLTIRDGVGYLLDVAMNPMNWILPFTTLFPMNVGNILNERSINLETFQGVEEATIDLYGAVRNAYLQKRAQAIRE
jgi:phospholipid-binding lipoprotein MlaA